MARSGSSNLGGARPGAGRKPKGRRRLMVNLDQPIYEILIEINARMKARSAPSVSLSDSLNAILRLALQRHPRMVQPPKSAAVNQIGPHARAEFRSRLE